METVKEILDYLKQSGAFEVIGVMLTVNILISIVKQFTTGMSKLARKTIFPILALLMSYGMVFIIHSIIPMEYVFAKGLLSGVLSVGFYSFGWRRTEKLLVAIIKKSLKKKGLTDEELKVLDEKEDE